MNKEEMREIIEETMKKQMESFFIEREQHYKDHMFIKDFREGAESIRGAACKVTTYGLISFAGGFILWSFRHWIKEVIGKL